MNIPDNNKNYKILKENFSEKIFSENNKLKFSKNLNYQKYNENLEKLIEYIDDGENLKNDPFFLKIVHLLTISKNPFKVIGILLSTVIDIDNLLKQHELNKQNNIIYTENDVLNMIEKYDREFKIDTFAYTKSSSFTVKDWFNKNKK